MSQVPARRRAKRSAFSSPASARNFPEESFLSLLHRPAGGDRRKALRRRGSALPGSAGDASQSRSALSESRRSLPTVRQDAGRHCRTRKRAGLGRSRFPNSARSAKNRHAARAGVVLLASQPPGEQDAWQTAPPPGGADQCRLSARVPKRIFPVQHSGAGYPRIRAGCTQRHEPRLAPDPLFNLRLLTLTQRKEVLRAFDRLTQSPKEFLQVLAAFNEVNFGGVHDEQVGRRVAKEEMLIRTCDCLEVFGRNCFLRGMALFG